MKHYTRIINEKTFDRKVKECENMPNVWVTKKDNQNYVSFESHGKFISFKKVYLNTCAYYVMYSGVNYEN